MYGTFNSGNSSPVRWVGSQGAGEEQGKSGLLLFLMSVTAAAVSAGSADGTRTMVETRKE
ncbi:hypothetical protein BGV40_06060 [Methanosarcina sp. Ant1]|nr:hypothetical protein BGV40_15650 [Methanosarcina sp. Ant1]OEU43063.1 hypothetical protein BGV40_06060 [Methanosarcina sp. Ant1]